MTKNITTTQTIGVKKDRKGKIKKYLSKAAKILLPSAAGLAVGLIAGPIASPVVSFLTSKLTSVGIAINPQNFQDEASSIIKNTSIISTQWLLDKLIEKDAEIDGKKIAELIKEQSKETDARLSLKIESALRPTLDSFREAVQYVKEYPKDTVETLREMEEQLFSDLSEELNESISGQISEVVNILDLKITEGFSSVKSDLIHVERNLGVKIDELASDLNSFFTQMLGEYSNFINLDSESALALCNEQLNCEPMASRYDIRYSEDLYIPRIDAEDALFEFIRMVNSPGGTISNIAVLLAGMGMGKTWLLGHIAHMISANGNPALFFQLQRGSLQRISRVIGAHDATAAQKIMRKIALATKKPLIIFLDGLDELDQSEHRSLLNWIIDTRNMLGQADIGFILSCREFDWISSEIISQIVSANGKYFYDSNVSGVQGIAFKLMQFNGEQLSSAAEKYGITEDIQRYPQLKSMVIYPFITKLLGNLKEQTNGFIPDPSDLEAFLPVFCLVGSENQEDTILGRMGIHGNQLGWFGQLIDCCFGEDFIIDMNKIQQKGLTSKLNYMLSSSLFITTIGLRPITKINPIYLPYTRKWMKLEGITISSDNGNNNETEPTPSTEMNNERDKKYNFFIDEGNEFVTYEEYDNALESYNNAIIAARELFDTELRRKTTELIEKTKNKQKKYNERKEKEKENEAIVRKAQGYMEKGLFKRSIELFKQSIDICKIYGLFDGINYAEQMIIESSQKIKEQEKLQKRKNIELVKNGENTFNNGEYEKSIEYFSQSKNLCEKYHWQDKIQYVNGMIGKCTQKLNEQPVNYHGTMIVRPEYNVMLELEKMLGQPIPFRSKNKIKEKSLGFFAINNHVVKIFITLRIFYKISSLPESIGSLTSLEELYLLYNPLSSLPESIGSLKSLKILKLRGNRLASLPESIGSLKSLEILNLRDNRLASLPESIGSLKSLEILNLRDNQLASLPESIGSLTSLEDLDLDYNHLTSLPESICSLKSLKHLILGHNRLNSLPERISSLKSLEFLSIGRNPYSHPEMIEKQLKILENNGCFLNGRIE